MVFRVNLKSEEAGVFATAVKNGQGLLLQERKIFILHECPIISKLEFWSLKNLPGLSENIHEASGDIF